MNLAKLSDIILNFKVLENNIEGDNRDANNVERRVKDLSILFKDLIKSVIKEMHNELSAKMILRAKFSQ
jgi:hypothetical protein